MFAYFLGLRFGEFQLGYSDIALVGVGVAILFELLMLVATYETPRWLFSNNMDYNGTRILTILRGKKYQVTKEINEIKSGLKKKTSSVKEQFLTFKHQAVYHPFILVVCAMAFKQLTGVTTYGYSYNLHSSRMQ